MMIISDGSLASSLLLVEGPSSFPLRFHNHWSRWQQHLHLMSQVTPPFHYFVTNDFNFALCCRHWRCHTSMTGSGGFTPGTPVSTPTLKRISREIQKKEFEFNFFTFYELFTFSCKYKTFFTFTSYVFVFIAGRWIFNEFFAVVALEIILGAD